MRDDLEVNGKSIMGVMMLAAEYGSTLVVRADGPDADQAVDRHRRAGGAQVRRVVVKSRLSGIPASPGIAIGPVHLLHWEVPDVPQRIIADEEVNGEIARFHGILQRAHRSTATRARSHGEAGR